MRLLDSIPLWTTSNTSLPLRGAEDHNWYSIGITRRPRPPVVPHLHPVTSSTACNTSLASSRCRNAVSVCQRTVRHSIPHGPHPGNIKRKQVSRTIKRSSFLLHPHPPCFCCRPVRVIMKTRSSYPSDNPCIAQRSRFSGAFVEVVAIFDVKPNQIFSSLHWL